MCNGLPTFSWTKIVKLLYLEGASFATWFVCRILGYYAK